MLAGISGDLFMEWKAFYVLEPFGEEWMQTAKICAAIESALGGAKFNPEKFMPTKMPAAVPSPAEMFGRFIQAPPKP